MLSDRTREMYRRMTPEERLRLTFELIEEGWRYIQSPCKPCERRRYWGSSCRNQ